MEADPDFNPNKAEHRILSLEALDRTSSKLLSMNGIKMDMPTVEENKEEAVEETANATQSPSANDLARANLDNLMGGSNAVVSQRRNSE